MILRVISTDQGFLHLSLVGRLDIPGVAAVEKEFVDLVGDGSKSVIVDVSGVTYTGSMGLRILLIAVKALKHSEKELILLNPQPFVEEILDSAGITDVLVVSHDLDQAIAQAKA